MCGILGIIAREPSVTLTQLAILGTRALNERGQDSRGIVGKIFNQDEYSYDFKQIGDEGVELPSNPAQAAVSQTRYTTAGEMDLLNQRKAAQPAIHQNPDFAWSWNGQLGNTTDMEEKIRHDTPKWLPRSDADTELFVQRFSYLLEQIEGGIEKRMKHALDNIANGEHKINGAYSAAVLLPNDGLLVFRHAHETKPLVMARTNGMYAFASETSAFDAMNCARPREDRFRDYEQVKGGEAIYIRPDLSIERWQFSEGRRAWCTVETSYVHRPESRSLVDINRLTLDDREMLGRKMWDVHHELYHPGMKLVPVPDSGIGYADGFALAAGVPRPQSIIRDRQANLRMFIAADDLQMQILLAKLRFLHGRLGKEEIVFDDTLMSGKTMKRVVDELRYQGVEKIHVMIPHPNIKHLCTYATQNIRDPNKLLGYRFGGDEKRMAEYLRADSINFLGRGDYSQALGTNVDDWCWGCTYDEYPTANTVDERRELFQYRGYKPSLVQIATN